MSLWRRCLDRLLGQPVVSVKVMGMVWEAGPRSAADRMMLLALADNANDDGGQCWPSVDRLAAKCCVQERAARYALRRLEKAGWITTTVGGQGARATSHYQIELSVLRRGQETAPYPEPRGHLTTPKGASDDSKGASDDTEGGNQLPPNHQEPPVSTTTKETTTAPSPTREAGPQDFFNNPKWLERTGRSKTGASE